MPAASSPPPLMRAVQIERFGPIEQLPVNEVPRPTPAPGEVLVRVEAASVNPSDVKNVQGNFPSTNAL